MNVYDGSKVKYDSLKYGECFKFEYKDDVYMKIQLSNHSSPYGESCLGAVCLKDGSVVYINRDKDIIPVSAAIKVL
jgi:hypothetical protein